MRNRVSLRSAADTKGAVASAALHATPQQPEASLADELVVVFASIHRLKTL
jgi:hypothetical protein